ncbi:NAD(P)-binding protein [Panacagrimonas sp.]|uniref:NAD(P)-binding protein n=1 Tax=Panacagrimonas sp. TaxID=2480088 RepID=UPI003B52412C
MNTTSTTIDCELCVIGAGIAGLNALHSASRYLKPTDQVVLIDARPGAGGMWRDTYDYVRLHQPYQMFTVGDIPWVLKKPATYLADKTEVGEQLTHCMAQLRQRFQLQEHYCHRYLAHQESSDAEGPVEIQCKRINDGQRLRVRARRLVKAISYDIKPSAAMKFSSSAVRSLSPHDLGANAATLGADDAPVYVVGGGKTAMDTAHLLVRRFPGRDIRMLIGEGCLFLDRSRSSATGWRRWFGGQVAFETFLDTALRFDGGNIQATYQHFLSHHGLALNERARQFQFGAISPEEIAAIRSSAREVIEDYLVDVTDGDDGPLLQLRQGQARPIPAGSWLINCTGYIARDVGLAPEPYISEGGKVLSINQTSMVFFLGSFSGYFLTHLFYRDRLRDLPLYQGDVTALRGPNKSALGVIGATQTVLNVLLCMQALPVSVFNECRLDFNRWYPLPRRLPILLRFQINSAKYLKHCRAALDRIEATTGVRWGVLPHVQAAATNMMDKAA